MDGPRRAELVSRLEGLGYAPGEDGIVHICLPFRELEKEELEEIFDGRQPKKRFDALMDRLARQELEALAGRLEGPPEELAQVAEVSLPLAEHLRHPYRCDILVDTGDSGSDYCSNTLAPSYDGFVYGSGYRVPDDASILWLTRQQGHTRRELSAALHRIASPDHGLEGFLKSAAREVQNELSCQNQLCFLVMMPLEQAMLIQTAVEWGWRTRRWNGYLVLDREGRAGFFDTWRGSGSSMGLKPEQDVKLPMGHIAYVVPDKSLERYNVYTVYGRRDMWDKGRVKRITLPKKFRLEMEEMGFPPRLKNLAEEVEISSEP